MAYLSIFSADPTKAQHAMVAPRTHIRTTLVLLLHGALFVACVLHIPALLKRPSLPFAVLQQHAMLGVGMVRDANAAGGIMPGDIVVALDGRAVTVPEHLVFLADLRSIGDSAAITVRRGERVAVATICLVPAYTRGGVVALLFVALVAWSFALLVMLKRPGNLAATAIHWAMLGLAVVLIMAWEGPGRSGLPLVVQRTLFFASYVGVASTFLFLTTIFPITKPGSVLLKSSLIYGVAAALTVALISFHLRAAEAQTVKGFVHYSFVFSIFQVFLFAFVGGGVFNLAHSGLTLTTSVERKQLQWIVWGCTLGAAPFLLLTVLPGIIAPHLVLPEQYTLLALIVIPIAFAIAILKYHLLDIELVLRRTTAYALMFSGVIGVYIGLVWAMAELIGSVTPLTSGVAAVLVALGFEPARKRVQRFIDRRFFRVHYDYREAQRKLVEAIKNSLDHRQLAEVMITQTNDLIPVERVGFFSVEQPGNRLHPIAQKNFALPEHRSITFHSEQLKTGLRQPVALGIHLEPGIPHEAGDPEVFRRWGMAVVFPMLSRNAGVLGFFVVGPRKSGGRFSIEDIDLLRSASTQAGLAFERMLLQQQLFREEAETHRLSELNRLKSDFVASVSHELRTPLTSIKMFAELLDTRRQLDGRAQEYVRVIEGEADRLNRMVTTILDSAKIEQGVQEYAFAEVDLRAIADSVMEAMRYQLKSQRFTVEYRPGRTPLPLHADRDAVAAAIMNIVANAIKYSGEKRFLRLSLMGADSRAVCRVEDRGLGISPESLPHLFERFYRDPDHSKHARGVGLGLPLVKHIMDAHSGTVEVQSTVGKGSMFSLTFPLASSHEASTQPNRKHAGKRKRR